MYNGEVHVLITTLLKAKIKSWCENIIENRVQSGEHRTNWPKNDCQSHPNFFHWIVVFWMQPIDYFETLKCSSQRFISICSRNVEHIIRSKYRKNKIQRIIANFWHHRIFTTIHGDFFFIREFYRSTVESNKSSVILSLKLSLRIDLPDYNLLHTSLQCHNNEMSSCVSLQIRHSLEPTS